MNILVGVLAVLSIGSNQSMGTHRLVNAELSGFQEQPGALHLAMQRQNDLLRDFAAARVKECLEGSKDEKNPLLSGQMCVAAFYLRSAEFRAGFDMMLMAVDPDSAAETREILTELMVVLEKNGMRSDVTK